MCSGTEKIVILLLGVALLYMFIVWKKPEERRISRRNPSQRKKPMRNKTKNVKGDGPYKTLKRSGLYDMSTPNYTLGKGGSGVAPSESLKYTSQEYKNSNYAYPILGQDTQQTDYNVLKSPLVAKDSIDPFYNGELSPFSNSLYEGLYSSPYLGLSFFGNIDANAKGFKTIDTKWEKVGLLTTENQMDDSILNLYRRDIAPYQDLYEYSAQDKNGFIIPLEKSITYLENNDVIDHIVGKDTQGPWKVHLFYQNKYIYV